MIKANYKALRISINQDITREMTQHNVSHTNGQNRSLKPFPGIKIIERNNYVQSN